MGRKSLHFACLVLLFGLATAAMAAKPIQQGAGANGLVSVEAEHYDEAIELGSNTWELVESAETFTGEFSGGAAMQIMPDTPLGGRSFNTGYVENSSRLDFQVNFVKTGTHYVWVLAYGRDGNADSCHAGLDGEEIDTCDRMSGWNAQYRWSGNTMDNAPSTFEVDEIGVHTLNIYMREDGTAFDKILLTTNPDYTPTGNGPAESSRGIPDTATSPSPSDAAIDIPRDVLLAWEPGPSAASHDVYFGAVFEDVNAASRANPLDVLVSEAQTGTAYQPTIRLEFGQIYYWRVDAVNAPPDSTIFKGGVWSFTAEPFTYRLTGITATASSADEGFGPQNTVNNSGLANGAHSTDNGTMWVSSKTGDQPTWIQYEFDAVYKLHEMRVWNYNVVFEPVLGFGFKDVTVEHSADGVEWTALPETQFEQATAQDDYAFNTTVDFGGAAVRYVRLTANSNWGGLVQQYGLSEVRFYYIPVYARQPQPASGAAGVDVGAVLNWRAGREADTHEVYFGTDSQAVTDGTAAVDAVSASSYDPGPLAFGTTYYWKVIEVNETAVPSAWEGEVWSFATQEFLVVDDFESYTDEEGSRIYETWIDGWTNNTGSVVGYLQAPFAEQTIVNGGKQSMPFEYNNVGSPYYSEAERTWDTTQDWTANDADTLMVYFRGNPAAFSETAGTITMGAGGADIWNTADEFRFASKRLNGDGSMVVKVESLENSDPWAKAGVMIRDNLTAGAKNAMVYVTPDGRVGWQFRQLIGGTSDSTRSEPGAITYPYWVRMTRTGTELKAEHSSDGITWQPVVEVANPSEPTARNIGMGTTVYIGLAVTSHNSDATTTAVLSEVSTTGGVSGAWDVQAIGVAQPSNDPAPLYVTVQDSAGKSQTVNHSDPAATTLATWQPWPISLSEFSSGGVNLARVKTMIIGVGDRAQPTSDGAGLLFIDDIGVGHPAQ